MIYNNSMTKKKSRTKEKKVPELVSKRSRGMAEHFGLSVWYGVLFLFLAMNILFSQLVPQEYFQLWTEDKSSVIEFFKRARTLPAFQELFPENKNLFAQYEGDIYADERHTRDLIEKLEAALIVTPKSRDVLYSLSVLYEKNGDASKASEYLRRAREIDPEVGR
jgi:tetratricopeptide (TPR) repeat protein